MVDLSLHIIFSFSFSHSHSFSLSLHFSLRRLVSVLNIPALAEAGHDGGRCVDFFARRLGRVLGNRRGVLLAVLRWRVGHLGHWLIWLDAHGCNFLGGRFAMRGLGILNVGRHGHQMLAVLWAF